MVEMFIKSRVSFSKFGAILLLAALGCGATPPPKVVDEASRAEIPDVKVNDPEIRFDGIAEGTVTAQAAAPIRVEGRFKLQDPSQAPTPIVFLVKKTGATLGGSFVCGVSTKGDLVTFETEITAPVDLGTYTIEVVEGRTTMATRSLIVSSR